VEGRFPFLDHRLVELAARLPVAVKLRGGEGKRVLRRVAARLLPAIARRPKFPYRAPAAEVLTGPGAPGWAKEALSPEAVRAAGVFDPDKVARLVAKLAGSRLPVSEVDAMGVTAVATAQLLPRALAAGPGAAEVAAVELEVA
jgi:asparagine synthase (glutamine-hydrolysing)